MKKFLIALLLLVIGVSNLAQAQFIDATIGINGLTCSQCLHSVEKALRRLDFVKDVKMNLEYTEAKVVFNADKKVTPKRLAKAIKSAGFSVREIRATFIFTTQEILSNGCFLFQDDAYQIQNKNPELIKGTKSIIFLGDKLSNKKMPKELLQPEKATCKPNGGELYFINVE